ncbi:hypothetical protein HWV62_777 [Athelia sp. TMB]|nr:hypothetical protein HWV62_777 [Athelia sp. TMB]
MDAYRAIKLRQSSNLQQALKDATHNHTPLIGVGIGVPSVASTKLVAFTTADWAWIDAEHTPLSPTLLSDLVQTINYYSEGKMLPVVRVPTHTHEWIAWALDAGAAGVILPHIETAEQVRAAVAAAKFPPQGNRSFPPFIALPGLTDLAPEGKTWLDVANEHVAVIPQVESQLGLDNLEEIMQVEGISAVMIGKGDLRLDMALPITENGAISLGSKSWAEPAWVAAEERIRTLAANYRMPLVGVCNDGNVAQMVSDGYRMVFGASDFHALGMGITMIVEATRKLATEAAKLPN